MECRKSPAVRHRMGEEVEVRWGPIYGDIGGVVINLQEVEIEIEGVTQEW